MSDIFYAPQQPEASPPSLATPLGSFQPDRELTYDEQVMAQSQSPSAADILSSAFRQGNTVASAFSDRRATMTREIDPDFNLGKALGAERNDVYISNWDKFGSVFNQRDYDIVKSQIDMEDQDKRNLAAGGLLGAIAGVGSGFVDPTFLIPGVGQVNEARTAFNIGKAALRTAASFGAITAVQEGILQGTQATRSPEESAVAIGMGTLLGGFLGGGVHALSPAERQAGEAALHKLNSPEGASIPSSAGAAARDVLSREDLTPSGTAAQKVVDTTAQMNPVLRGQTSPSAAVREASQGLFENTIYQAGNDVGRTTGVAAESAIRVLRDSLMPEGLNLHNEIWREAKLANIGMNAPEFEEAVGRAMRRSDVGDNDFVSRAAQGWRQKVFDPLKNEAIKLELLPPDVSVDTADSYFTRMWAGEKINAQETQFKQILQNYFDGVLRQEFADDFARLQGRQSKIQQEIADLKLNPDQRTQAIRDIEAEQQQLYGNNPSHVDRADQLSDLRQQVAAANARNDRQTAASLKEAAQNLRKQGGDEFRAFEAQRASLNARRRNVELGYSALSSRRDTIEQQLADLNEANMRSMARLVQKGQKFQQDLQRVSPEVVAERVSQLRDAFAAEAAKAERQAERFKAQLDKIGWKEPAANPFEQPFDTAAPLEQMREFVIHSLGGDGQKSKIVFGPVGSDLANKIAPFIKSPERYRHAIDELGVRHIMKNHGEGGIRNQGLAPITHNDIARIPEIVSSYDEIGRGVDKVGKPTIGYLKKFADGTTVYIEEVRTGKKLLAAKTMYKWGPGKGPADITHIPGRDLERIEGTADPSARLDDAARLTSETTAASPDNIGSSDKSSKLAAGGDLLSRQLKASQARAERLNSIANRLEAAESLDPQAMADELGNGVSNLMDEVSNVSLGRGERAQRLQEKLGQLDPKKVDERISALEGLEKDFQRRHVEKWDIERGASGTHLPIGQQDFSQYSGDIANAIFDKLSGRGFDNNIPDSVVPATRGPLKERTFHIPDELVENFLESNIKHVAENYVRKMTSEIELTRKFGSADMKETLAGVQRDYDNVRTAVNNAGSIEEVRQIAQNDPGLLKTIIGQGDKNRTLDEVREQTLRYLRNREKSDLEDLQAGRDLMRGTYKASNMNTVWGRSVRAALQYNFITRMGSVVLSNISEAFRPAMVYGMSTYLKDGVAPLLSNLKSIGVQNAIRELKLAGVATERALQHRIQTFGEIGDPYARGTAAERFLNNMTRVAGKWGGLAHWTDMMKTVTGVVAQDRIIRLAQEGKDVRTLSYLGLNSAMRERVADQIKRFATKDDGAWAANTERWTDEEAIRHFRAALNKDVSSVIVTKSVGDVPLFANTPTGKILTQFKAFALASHQRILIRGLQENATNFMVGMASMTVMGMLATYLRAVATNRLDKLPGADNPGWWIGEGLDNTGIFAVPLELANDLEKPTGINPLKDPIRAAGRALTGATAKPESFRNTNRNGPGALLGPTFGQAADLFNVLGTLGAKTSGSKVSPGQAKSAINSAANLTPFYSYPLLRQMIDWGVKPAANQAVGAQ